MANKIKLIKNIPIETIAAEGKCVARSNNQVIFVEQVAPGDVVDVKITKKKKNYLHGYPVHFYDYSALRQDPVCEHFGLCGGCKWQHIQYDFQLKSKQQQVLDSFERIAKVNIPACNDIIAADNTTFYRNKLEFTFSNNKWLTQDEIDSGVSLNRNGVGFHIPGKFDKVLDIDQCHLQPDPSNAIRMAIKNYAGEHHLSFYDIREHKGFLRNLIIRTTLTGDLMVILQVGEDKQEQLKPLLDNLVSRFPEITSLYYVINRKKNETFHDQELIKYAGKPYIEEKMEDLYFRIGPKSFFQTNTSQAVKLYSIARDYARLTGNEIVYDLYTGIGTIANFIAKNVKTVVGIEAIPEAIEDAKINADINNIQNTHFISGDIKDMLNEEVFNKYGKPDVVITDPPRAGMHASVVKQLMHILPKRIVYISCNPATQARDVALMDDHYQIEVIQPVDMFPHTHHVENIVSLKRKNQ